MRRPLLVRLSTVCLLSASLAACSSAPKPVPSLDEARAAYNSASEDRQVVQHAPIELDAARNALSQAERAWRDKADREVVEHDAYLAAQRVEIARTRGEQRAADARLADSKLEQKEVKLQMRAGEIEQARAELEKMQRQLAELQAQQTERGMVLTLGDVLFDLGKATLRPGADRTIDRIAQFMQRYPERLAVIEGHTDSMGDEDFNMDLSRQRAFSVKSALIQRGVAGPRVSTRGFGESQPVASNDTRSGRQENRRVEVIFPDDVRVSQAGDD